MRILTISTAHPPEPKQRVTLVTYAYSQAGELVGVSDALGQAAHYQYQDRLLVQETFKNGLNFYFEYVGSGPAARCVHTWGDEGIYDHKLVYDVEARRVVVTNSLGYSITDIEPTGRRLKVGDGTFNIRYGGVAQSRQG